MNQSIKFELLEVDYSPLEDGFEPEAKAIIFREQQEWIDFCI